MRVGHVALFFVGSTLVWSAWSTVVYADSTMPICDVLNTSTISTTTAYSAAYCGVQTIDGRGNALTTQSTLYAIELNIAFNAGDPEYFMFTTSGPNFVGQSYNDYGQRVNVSGLGTGLHTFMLTTPITFPAGSIPAFHLYHNGVNGYGSTLGYGQPNLQLYGNNTGNGSQAVFYQKWFWVSNPPSITLLGDATTTVEFGSTFTDPGAIAHDDTDGDITSAIQIIGSVNANVLGTTTLSYAITNSHGLSATTTRAVVVTCTHDCYSNILFLPGIEGSRLYEGTGCGGNTEEKLWEPLGDGIIKILRGAGDDKVKKLFLSQSGESVCSDIYTKEGDVIDSVGGSNIYKSFIDEMNGLKTDNTIIDWKPIAYDWRLSLPDLLQKGAERDGKIFYEEATSTPYIEQTLRALAASSKTGKVSIIAHSNGGLVAKALLNQLGGQASKLVDKVIMVGAPQSGAPVDIGALLYGYDQGISSHGIPILHSEVARSLAENSPMAYHLLPSEDYLESIAADIEHRVATFAGAAYANEIAAYGATIGNRPDLDRFLLESTTLNSALIDYANSEHAALDFWAPPEGIEVSQIAGWGVDTVAGIDFYTLSGVSALSSLGPVRMYRPIFTEDGDGTVPVPSALMMSENTNVKRYWVDLNSYRIATSVKRSHRDLFEVSSLEDFIKNILRNSTAALPSYILSSRPPSTSDKKLTFFLHSPLTLQLADSSGNVTGLAEDNFISQDIPGSTYGEFGDVKYVTVPEGGQYHLTLHGQGSGTFSLDVQESTGGVVTAASTIASVPTTKDTLASLTISDGLDTASALTVDTNGDGANDITITPKAGETVNYEPPRRGHWRPAPLFIASSTPNTSSATTTADTVTTSPVSLEEPLAASTQATTAGTTTISTPETASSAKPIQIKEKKILPVAPPRTINPNIAQTASVYEASQQPVLKKLGEAVYYNLYRIWRGLKIIFFIQK